MTTTAGVVRTTIRSKLALVVFVAVGVSLLVGTVVSLWREADRYAQATRSTLLTTAHLFAVAAAQATADKDRSAAIGVMRAMGRVPDLVVSQIVAADGEVIATLGTALRLDGDLDLVGEAGISPLHLLWTRTVGVAVPIVHQGVAVGRFVLVADARELPGRLVGALAWTGAGALLALFAGLLVAWQQQRRITQPIVDLTQAVDRIRTDHDYKQDVHVASDDETAILVDHFNAMVAAIRERDGRITAHLQGLEQEIAERTADLRAARDAAEAAHAAKSDFLATMSHELRTPLNGMLVMADLLAATGLPGRAGAQAQVVANSGRLLLSIINDILDLSKIEAGKIELEILDIEPVSLAEDVVTLFAERARGANLDLAVVAAPDVPAVLQGDPVRLRQVLGNLVSNALKFTSTGHVLVDVSRCPDDPTAVLFAVRDTGIGIPPEKIDTIFSAFTQADQSTTRQYGGTGLGLTIARRLVHAMGGNIRVESVVGKGSTFTLRVPGAAGPSVAPPAAGRTAMVLVDGIATERSLFGALARLGYAPGPFGADGPDLVLVVPDRIAEAPASASVVVVDWTGSQAGDRLVQEGRARAVLERPVRTAMLGQIIDGIASGAPVQITTAVRKIARFPGLRVLVADDAAVNREVAGEALNHLGVEHITFVNDGRAAVEACRTGSFHVVLMDGSMPELDGFEATRTIRAEETANGRPRTPIVALTAHVIGAAAEAWRDAGMDGVLHKPFTLEALADTLARFHDPAGIVDEPRTAAASDVPETPHNPGAAAEAGELFDPAVRAQLDEMAKAGRADFVTRIYGLFIEHGAKTMAQAEEAARADDLEALAAAAHALKSMSLNIGAVRVSAAALAAETAARADERDTALAALAAMRSAFATTVAALDKSAPSVAPPAPASVSSLSREIDRAIAHEELELVYQPIYDRQGVSLVAGEALLRWNHPSRGRLGPGLFIPEAEESGQIIELGTYVIERAAAEVCRFGPVPVAVNVSAKQFQKAGFANLVRDIMARHDVRPGQIEFELTESVLAGAEADIHDVMRELQAQGIRLALDDFGTGYSSLTYLLNFKFDKLKIDRSFVRDAPVQVTSATIVHAVASIGRALGLTLVAEGIETEEQHRFVATAGIHQMQGFFFSEPVSCAAFEALVRRAHPVSLVS